MRLFEIKVPGVLSSIGSQFVLISWMKSHVLKGVVGDAVYQHMLAAGLIKEEGGNLYKGDGKTGLKLKSDIPLLPGLTLESVRWKSISQPINPINQFTVDSIYGNFQAERVRFVYGSREQYLAIPSLSKPDSLFVLKTHSIAGLFAESLPFGFERVLADFVVFEMPLEFPGRAPLLIELKYRVKRGKSEPDVYYRFIDSVSK